MLRATYNRQDCQVNFVQINHCANQFFLCGYFASSTDKDKTCSALQFEILSTLSAKSLSGIFVSLYQFLGERQNGVIDCLKL